MNYRLHRVEVVPDRHGKDELFVHLTYTDAQGNTIPFAKWLSSLEYEEYLKDKGFLTDVLIPEWEQMAITNYQNSMVTEEVVSVEKIFPVLVEAGILNAATVKSLTKEQIDDLDARVKIASTAEVSEIKVEPVVKRL